MTNILLFFLALISFSTQFVQEKQSAMLTTPIISKGQLIYKEPDYIKWEYTSPKSLVWEFKAGQTNNTNRHINELISFIGKCVRGDKKILTEDFFIKQSNNIIYLSPKKRELKHLFHHINIYINEATQVATRVEFTETNGDSTSIKFYDTMPL